MKISANISPLDYPEKELYQHLHATEKSINDFLEAKLKKLDYIDSLKDVTDKQKLANQHERDMIRLILHYQQCTNALYKKLKDNIRVAGEIYQIMSDTADFYKLAFELGAKEFGYDEDEVKIKTMKDGKDK